MDANTEPQPRSLAGWETRKDFLAAHPELKKVLPNRSSLDYTLRQYREELKPYLAQRGRDTMIHSDAGPKLVELLLRRAG